MTIGATLNGTVLLGDIPETWRLQPGVEPSITEVSVPIGALDKLLKIPRYKATLTLGSLVVKQLSVIGHTPGPDAYMARVRLADARYWWPTSTHVLLHVNIRRRIGQTTRGAWDEVLRPAPVGVLRYRRYSADPGGKAQKGTAVLEKIFKQMSDQLGHVTKPLLLDKSLLKSIPIEDLFIDVDGASAVRLALQKLPGFNVTVDPSGAVVFYHWGSGAERKIVTAMGAETKDRGHVQLIDHANTMPKAIEILFTPEIEMRFDALDLERVPGGTVEARGKPLPERHLQNVAPVSDWSLTLGKRTVGQGTFVPIAEQMVAWDAAAPGALLAGLTDETIRRAMIPGRGDALYGTMATAGIKDPSAKQADWIGRISMIMEHYRKTYMLPTDWLDLIQEMRPYLCATIDTSNGQRAPARCYSDHCKVNAVKALYQQTKGEMFWGTNVPGYPGDKKQPLIGTKPAPCKVAFPDQDQGIIELNYLKDVYGNVATVLPSHVTPMPKRKFRQGSRHAISFNGLAQGGVAPALSPTSRAAVFFTVIPAHMLYSVRVETASLAPLFPQSAKASLKKARGPVMRIRIPSTSETARIAYHENWRDLILQAFREGKVPAGLRKYCINDKPQGNIRGDNAASLQAIATAVATAACAIEVDRVHGSKTTAMRPGVVCRGAIGSVVHMVGAEDGAPETQVSMLPRLRQIDWLAYAPPATQRIVARTVY